MNAAGKGDGIRKGFCKSKYDACPLWVGLERAKRKTEEILKKKKDDKFLGCLYIEEDTLTFIYIDAEGNKFKGTMDQIYRDVLRGSREYKDRIH